MRLLFASLPILLYQFHGCSAAFHLIVYYSVSLCVSSEVVFQDVTVSFLYLMCIVYVLNHGYYSPNF